MTKAYYNDNDPFAAKWLTSLVKKGLIADGDVDNRSILDVQASDLKGYTQCHFFAGIGGWSYALRLAGISDDTECWTGSAPCQPFSLIGELKGVKDERHLAPKFFELIKQCRPNIIFGEQVSGNQVFGDIAGKTRGLFEEEPKWSWLGDIYTELENAHYAVGASDIPAASVGSPMRRQRCFFGAIRMANTQSQGLQGRGEPVRFNVPEMREEQGGWITKGCMGTDVWSKTLYSHKGADGQRRKMPLAVSKDPDGLSNRVGRVKGYGNAIVPQVAAVFVRSFVEAARDF